MSQPPNENYDDNKPWLDAARLDTQRQADYAVAFADLPTEPTEGMMRAVADSSTAIWGATVTDGGANHVLAYFNGTNWTVVAK